MIKQLLQKTFFPEITRLTKENIELIEAVKEREQDIYNMIKHEFGEPGQKSRSKWLQRFNLCEIILSSNVLTTPNELQEIITTYEEIKNNKSENNPSRPTFPKNVKHLKKDNKLD